MVFVRHLNLTMKSNLISTFKHDLVHLVDNLVVAHFCGPLCTFAFINCAHLWL